MGCGVRWFVIGFFPLPIGSMYAIYGNIYHPYTPNVSIYTIHGPYGLLNWVYSKWLASHLRADSISQAGTIFWEISIFREDSHMTKMAPPTQLRVQNFPHPRLPPPPMCGPQTWRTTPSQFAEKVCVTYGRSLQDGAPR